MINTKTASQGIKLILCWIAFHTFLLSQAAVVVADGSPRIITIVNFIRQTDYRLKDADSLLFDATERELALMKKYQLSGTFLLQYDALINPKYQTLLKGESPTEIEVGAWWEITQPHVEAAGIKWRGKHPWVSTANIAFTTGYTQQERERLVDVYMEKFKAVFGRYPKSVGSWFIDSHTLGYMYKKYQIVASSNCKDQVGTDGYTLWGGYWNQAYYPSVYNAYMPAQSTENQIPVPVFRMLGSDPIYQYDLGVGTGGQGVITLEPVYEDGGMDKKWTRSFFNAIVDQPSLAFNYAQAGQENSFTWDAMKKGLEMQFPMIDSLRKVGKVRVQTLEEAGRWFSEQFPQTPATAVVALDDYREQGNKSIWYNSRFYRANLYWEKNAFRVRDIHLFDEHFKSLYLDKPGTEGQFYYFTLPLVDGFFWSTKTERAGLRIMHKKANGEGEELILQAPSVTEPDHKTLEVRSRDQYGNLFVILLKEKELSLRCEPKQKDLKWFFELKVPTEKQTILPFKNIAQQEIAAVFKDHAFRVRCKKGTLLTGKDASFVFQVHPQKQQLALDLGIGN
ncbi:hypothetical protein [Sphingobacterium bambusae]|uniref:DUF4832 domain-containing protein n=1 Tax=Sphingobacterium bambusae TaxID=662858 RepID=A0ABW6BD71_9SPHI|nr:hypothetical protein [Sphingobacterium bambusae]WPL49560.1 hypothetical protein SCB77_03730 [Sphingobacterium bambusae]